MASNAAYALDVCIANCLGTAAPLPPSNQLCDLYYGPYGQHLGTYAGTAEGVQGIADAGIGFLRYSRGQVWEPLINLAGFVGTVVRVVGTGNEIIGATCAASNRDYLRVAYHALGLLPIVGTVRDVLSQIISQPNIDPPPYGRIPCYGNQNPYTEQEAILDLYFRHYHPATASDFNVNSRIVQRTLEQIINSSYLERIRTTPTLQLASALELAVTEVTSSSLYQYELQSQRGLVHLILSVAILTSNDGLSNSEMITPVLVERLNSYNLSNSSGLIAQIQSGEYGSPRC